MCNKFNAANAEEIAAGHKIESSPNLYAIDRPFVQATTSPDASARKDIPAKVLAAGNIPDAPEFACCFSQLLNPDGLVVDVFVSHWWGHPFEHTVRALSIFADSVYKDLGKESLDDVVFWICMFALNQHQAADEVGSSPELGPFNAALAKARYGAVMILGASAEPFKRVWCLYEVQRGKHFGKHFELMTDEGRLAAAGPGTLEEIGKSLLALRAYHANASCDEDKLIIHYRIANIAYGQ